MRRALIALALVLALPLPAAASCSFNSFALLIFGQYDIFSPNALESSGEFSFTCTGRNPQQVIVSISHGNSNNSRTRAMRAVFGQSGILLYDVFSDPGHTRRWGDGAYGTPPVTVVAQPNIPVNLLFYGLAPALQDVYSGTYVDALTVTLEY